MAGKVVAILGGYRRGGMTEQAVEAILEGARQQGAETKRIRLIDEPIEFCSNCRACTQSAEQERGRCRIDDGAAAIAAEALSATALVVASPVNYWNVTAVTRRLLERQVCTAYWPWGGKAPRVRAQSRLRPAALVSSCAMPFGWMIPGLTGAGRSLRALAESFGARPVARLWIGMASLQPQPELPPRIAARARRIGERLAASGQRQ